MKEETQVTARIEVKIDKSTLPKDGQWIRFETYEQDDLIGQYIEADALISHIDNGFTDIYHIYTWEPLEITWTVKEWLYSKEGLAILEGFDRFGNQYTASGETNSGDIIKVEEIEFVG